MMTEDIFNTWKAEQARKTTVSSMCILFFFYKHKTIQNEKCDLCSTSALTKRNLKPLE